LFFSEDLKYRLLIEAVPLRFCDVSFYFLNVVIFFTFKRFSGGLLVYASLVCQTEIV